MCTNVLNMLSVASRYKLAEDGPTGSIVSKKACTDTTVFVVHPGQLTDDVGNNVVLGKLKGIFCTLQM